MFCTYTRQGCVLPFEKLLEAEPSGHVGKYLTHCIKARVTKMMLYKFLTVSQLCDDEEATGTLSNVQGEWQLIPNASTVLPWNPTPKISVSLPKWCQHHPCNTFWALGKVWEFSFSSYNYTQGVMMSAQNFSIVTASEKEMVQAKQRSMSTQFCLLTCLKGFQASAAAPKDKASDLKSCWFTCKFDFR